VSRDAVAAPVAPRAVACDHLGERPAVRQHGERFPATVCGKTGGKLRTMLVSSLYDDAEPTDVEAGAPDAQAAPEWPTTDTAPSESSSGESWPLVVVGAALVLGVAAAKWIAWSSRGDKH
jgi:hypothetical protein